MCCHSLGVLSANSIRFAPPLVISEEDLMKAVKIIAEALQDLDKVRALTISRFAYMLTPSICAG